MLRDGRARGRSGRSVASRSSVYGVAFTATRVNFSTFDNELTLPRRLARLAARRCSTTRGARRAALRPGVDAQPQADPRRRAGSSTRGDDDVIARSDDDAGARASDAAWRSTRSTARRCCARRSSTRRRRHRSTRSRWPASRGWRSRALLRRLCPLLSSRPRAAGARRATAAPGGRAARAAGRGGPGSRVVLAVALGLRVWGVKHGLPYAYNADENAHFVPKAIGLFGHGWNPHYFVNPPAYTYLLHVVFAVWFGGRAGRLEGASPTDPTEVFVVARVTARRGRHARRLAAVPGRRAALRPPLGPAGRGAARRRVPARLLLAPGAQRRPDAGADRAGAVGHRRRSCARARCATTCSPASASAWPARRSTPAASCCCRCSARRRDPPCAAPVGRSAAARGLVLAGVVALAAFVVANPYARARLRGVPRRPAAPGRRRRRRARQARPDPELRAPLLPVDAHLGAGLGAARRRRRGLGAARRRRPARARRARPGAVLFVLFMGTQERFFGRWLLPVFPIACLLGRLRDRAPRRSSPARRRAGAGARARRARAPSSLLRPGDRLLAAQRRWCSRAPTRAT